MARPTRKIRPLLQRERRAFTLVELLVVVAVIAILASLLMPSLVRAKNKAASAQCLNNLHQWGLAYGMYADDHDDFLPRRGQGVQPLFQIDRPEDWFNALPQYFGMPSFNQLLTNNQAPAAYDKSVFVCPAASNPGGTYFLPYGMNMNLCPWNLPVATRMSGVSQPTRVVALGDAPGPYASTYPSKRPYSVMARHATRVNLLFLAGQAGNFDGSYIGCGVGDPHVPDVSWLTGTDSDATAAQY
jgi:prepilin-type N-terminal cleavage/methylation domain-containing protein